MNHGIDIRKVRINCFRQSKVTREFMLQTRVSGAVIEAKHLKLVQDLCERFGNGIFHLGAKQIFDISGVKYENIEEANKYIKSYIHDVDVGMCGVDMDVMDHGYPTIGVRNIMSRIGDTHCIKSNANTYELAREIGHLAFSSHYHVKVVVAGCLNDCIKASFNDLGIMDTNKQVYDIDHCIGCGSYVDARKHHVTGVLNLNQNGKIDKDAYYCVGCDGCPLICPTGAWTRGGKKLHRVTPGERTGKQNPRVGKLPLDWVMEDVILGMFANWRKLSVWALDYKPEYPRGGHLIGRVRYKGLVKHIFEGVEFNPEAKTADDIFWAENEQWGDMHVMSLSEYKHAGPQEPAKKKVQGVRGYQQQRGGSSSGGCEYMLYCSSAVFTQRLAAP